MELLDIVDENGIPTGAVIDRETAHREAFATAPLTSGCCAEEGTGAGAAAKAQHGKGLLSRLL